MSPCHFSRDYLHVSSALFALKIENLELLLSPVTSIILGAYLYQRISGVAVNTVRLPLSDFPEWNGRCAAVPSLRDGEGLATAVSPKSGLPPYRRLKTPWGQQQRRTTKEKTGGSKNA
jgi:hypothetical protein